jgi:hypothetical protein
MPSRIRTKLEKLLIAPALLLCAPIGVRAGFIKFWQLKEIAAAPVLGVGRVLEVQKNARVPDGSLPWNAETWSMTAEIQVLRLHSSSEEPPSLDRIRVSFLSYGPSVTRFRNGPPPLPQFEPGQVMILPLRENKAPASESWHLTADSGVGLTIPAREEMESLLPQPNSARAFIVREIANSLSRGTPREISAAAGYLAEQHEDLRAELMPQLEPVIGDDRPRWAELAANLLAVQGIRRPSVAELLTNKDEPAGWPGRESFFLAQSALLKLKPYPETDALLIGTWFRQVPLHSWGSANALLQYADNPVTIESLRQALRDDVVGSSYVAWTFADAGHPTALPEALERALKVADRPKTDPTDLQGAAATLRDYGSDHQLNELADLVRKYQTVDRNFYSMLWQYATEAGNPREARVLAVVLRDRRFAFDNIRYCDIAVGVLERAVGQQFGSNGGKTEKERDDALTRALIWLKSQGISDF